jgi:hypothetical protein
VSEVFNSYEFDYEDCKYLINSDFSDLFARAESKNAFYGGIIEMKISCSNLDSRKNIENFIILSYIDVLFLCSNFAYPGSMNIRSSIELNNESIEEINLTGGYFESATETSYKFGGWPEIRIIPIKYVLEWYNSLNVGLKIKAENNIERALFSTLYFSHDTYAGYNPTLIVWIIHALESIYGIKSNDSIIKALKNRIFLHLGQTSQPKKVNKKINEFYDYRSKFVHGDMEIMRLGGDKFLREDFIDDYNLKLIDLCDFGATLVISSIQKMIINDAKTMEFNETISYK